MARRTFIIGLIAACCCGTVLRTLWLRSDPAPDNAGHVGVVWHDEGAWVHNARNKALWDTWRTDNWNPVFIAPVFTELEYVAFREFGVGTWQARTVPVASGLVAIAFLILGLNAVAGRRAAMIGAWLLATNYIFVMWNRAALMESTMTMFVVISWATYAMAEKRPRWGLVAGAAVVLAWFTKASAAFFLAAIVLDCCVTIAQGLIRPRGSTPGVDSRGRRAAAWFTLVGMAIAGLAVVTFFVWPHRTEYFFYNVQMSVERKPAYTLNAFRSNASWLPINSDFFTRMWLALVAAAVAIAAIAAEWRTAKPAERLLVLWLAVGLLELVVHGAGEERYYVPLIPALIALASWYVGADRPRFTTALASPSRRRWIAAPLLLGLGYLVLGSVLRIAFADDVKAGHVPVLGGIVRAVFGDDLVAGHVHVAVNISAIAAVALTAVIVWRWTRIANLLSTRAVPAIAAVAFIAVSVGWNLFEYGAWAVNRRDANYQASLAVGRLLPPGTLVHGKLANGLSLENQIKPIFVGDHFGNFDDRLNRDDVRYILTYASPNFGYEGPIIRDVLNHYPGKREIASFDVDETGGPDRAALFDKFPGRPTASRMPPVGPEVVARARD